jgi:mRNA interferase YafQ
MRRIERSAAFKRDYRRAKAMTSYRDLDGRLVAALELLITDRPLPSRYRDHALSGNWSGHRDCHLWPNLLLIYGKPSADVLRLVRLGSHSDLFD